MGEICAWLMTHNVEIFDFINSQEKPILQMPQDWWWILVAAIKRINQHVNITFRKLQSKDLVLSQQREELEHLALALCDDIGIDGPFDPAQIQELEQLGADGVSMCGRWCVSHDNVIRFIANQGLWVHDKYEGIMDDTQQNKIVRTVGRLCVSVVDGITNIQTERDSNNKPMDDLPPIMPHQLIKLRESAFSDILRANEGRLMHSFNGRYLGTIEQQHQDLCTAYLHEPIFKSVIDSHDHNTSFKESWSILDRRYPALREFCGAIASVFPNTAMVEADFSLLGWEKDVHHLSMMDLTLESVLQCRQFESLLNL